MKLENWIAGAIVVMAFGWVVRSLWRSAKEKAARCAKGCCGCAGSCGIPEALKEAAGRKEGEEEDTP